MVGHVWCLIVFISLDYQPPKSIPTGEKANTRQEERKEQSTWWLFTPLANRTLQAGRCSEHGQPYNNTSWGPTTTRHGAGVAGQVRYPERLTPAAL